MYKPVQLARSCLQACEYSYSEMYLFKVQDDLYYIGVFH